MIDYPSVNMKSGRNKHHDMADSILWSMPFFFFSENIFGGPLGVAPCISGRYMLFFLTLFSLLLIIIKKRGVICKYARFPLSLIIFFLTLNFIWASLVPALSYTSLYYSWSEAKPFCGLLLVVFFVLAAKTDLSRFIHLVRWIVLCTIILSWLQLFLWIFGTVFPESQMIVGLTIKQIYSADSIYVGLMPDGFFRVFWISSIWLIPALFYLPLVIKSSLGRIFSFVGIAGALFATYSRGFWIGIAIGMFFWLLPRLVGLCRSRVRVNSLILTPMLLMAVVFLVFWIAPSIADRISMLFSLMDDSVNERILQSQSLLSAWMDSPLIGSGYGSSAEVIRSISAPYSYEMVPLALLMKLGVIGLMWFTVFFTIVVLSSMWVMLKHIEEASALLGALIAFLVSAMTNPMLLNFVGISILAILLIHWVFLFRYIDA